MQYLFGNSSNQRKQF